jgi:methylated-DNA-[protein]-cysteine S-methyltransferase
MPTTLSPVTASDHWTAAHGFLLFDTAVGRCAMAWSERGVVGIQLPEVEDRRTAARLLARIPGVARESSPPAPVQRAVDGIVALLGGEAVDLSFVPLDTDRVPVFDCQVYEAARLIPPGTTRTYGEVARQAGAPREARAVGQALGRNPFAIVVPCHRVVAADGRLGGFSAHGGAETKRRLLAIEGVSIPAAVTLF